ncbi:hypothetical protein JCM33774_50850 [Actinophytocola sp. KF-1]
MGGGAETRGWFGLLGRWVRRPCGWFAGARWAGAETAQAVRGWWCGDLRVVRVAWAAGAQSAQVMLGRWMRRPCGWFAVLGRWCGDRAGGRGVRRVAAETAQAVRGWVRRLRGWSRCAEAAAETAQAVRGRWGAETRGWFGSPGRRMRRARRWCSGGGCEDRER